MSAVMAFSTVRGQLQNAPRQAGRSGRVPCPRLPGRPLWGGRPSWQLRSATGDAEVTPSTGGVPPGSSGPSGGSGGNGDGSGGSGAAGGAILAGKAVESLPAGGHFVQGLQLHAHRPR